MENIVILESAISASREKAIEYLDNLRGRTPQGWGWRMGSYHDPQRDPYLFFYSTWCGVYLSCLLGVEPEWGEEFREGVIATLCSGQREDGLFQQLNWSEKANNFHSWQYALFHATNYAFGALHLLNHHLPRPFIFLDLFKNNNTLNQWLEARCMLLPGMEGNNIVNLASFFLEHYRQGNLWAMDSFNNIVDWHLYIQNPSTGYFDRLNHDDERNILHSLTGIAHNAHIFWWTNNRLPFAHGILNDSLRFLSLGSTTACTDIDLVDLVAHLIYDKSILDDELVEDIANSLYLFGLDLIQRQNSDGGFSDNYFGNFSLSTYYAPHKESNIWATWFRLATIAMISESFGIQSHNWKFRNTIGMGYYKNNYLETNKPKLIIKNPNYKLIKLWQKRRQQKVDPGILKRAITHFGTRTLRWIR